MSGADSFLHRAILGMGSTMQIPKRRQQVRLSADEPVYLTPDGIRRLEERLARLKRELPDAALEAQRTAAYGDRSDNAEYKEAKGMLRRTQRQIWNLEDQMKRAVAIVPGKNKGVIELGSTVTIETENGTKKKYQILGTLETNPERNIISHKSPLGAALIGHKKGDSVSVKIANGIREYRIVEIS
jgi:transcription elongation GreA/GreB family factor